MQCRYLNQVYPRFRYSAQGNFYLVTPASRPLSDAAPAVRRPAFSKYTHAHEYCINDF